MLGLCWGTWGNGDSPLKICSTCIIVNLALGSGCEQRSPTSGILLILFSSKWIDWTLKDYQSHSSIVLDAHGQTGNLALITIRDNLLKTHKKVRMKWLVRLAPRNMRNWNFSTQNLQHLHHCRSNNIILIFFSFSSHQSFLSILSLRPQEASHLYVNPKPNQPNCFVQVAYPPQ